MSKPGLVNRGSDTM